MSDEIKKIQSEARMKATILRVNHAELKIIEKLIDKNIINYFLKNITDENLQKLIDNSIELEYFKATIILKKELDKRKSF